MVKPVIIINFKTYMQGKDLLDLAKAVEAVDNNIIVGVPASEISDIFENTDLVVYAQHVDYQEPGRNTGYILPEAVKAQGAKGVFLNHSEHWLGLDVIKKTVLRCKKIGLKVVVFVKDLKQAKVVERLSPDYLIYEPPELVAGDVSVSLAKPEVIEKICNAIKMPVLVGAGIKTNIDIQVAMKRGARGVAFASVITKAKDPKKVLKELLGK